MINNYLGALGLLTFISGRYVVRFLLNALGTTALDHPNWFECDFAKNKHCPRQALGDSPTSR